MQPRGDVEGRPPVCRRLFADEEDETAEPGERDNMLNQINEQINRDLDDACKKYNFDFRNEVPLEGDFKWERIPPEGAEDPPENLEVPPPTEDDPKESEDPKSPPRTPENPQN